MSAGDSLLVFVPQSAALPASNPATFDTRNAHPCLDFDATTQETAYFSAIMPLAYSGSGLTVYLHWAATSATSGTIGWDVAIERIGDAVQDVDSDGFATAQTVTAATVPGTAGHVKVTMVELTDGAVIDSLAAGEMFRLRVRRDVATDTATGDAELYCIHIAESAAAAISALDVTDIKDTSLTVTWTTNVPASSQVEYGTTSSYGSSTTLDSTLVTNHSVSVTGLTANTLYHFRAVSGGTNGDDQTVTTARVHEGFDNATSSYWNDVYTHAANYTPNTSETPYVTSPKVSGTHALNYYVQPTEDEITSRQVGLSEFTPAITESYVRWYERFATGYPWPVGSQKMCRHIYYNESDGIANECLLNVTGSGDQLQVFWVEITGGSSAEANDSVDNPFQDDTWHLVELHIKLNTLGSANGFVKVWVDGTLLIDMTNQQQRTGSNNFGWNIMWVGGNYTNQGAVTGTGNRYIDELTWFNTRPSWYA